MHGEINGGRFEDDKSFDQKMRRDRTQARVGNVMLVLGTLGQLIGVLHGKE